MSRLLTLSLALVASACATGSGAFAKNPYTFPSQAALQQVALRPAPARLYSQQVAEVETWTVENTRTTASQAAFTGELPFRGEVDQAFTAHAQRVTISDALSCVAQEIARFRATTQGAPSQALERFISARCGSPQHASLTWLSVTSDAPADVVRERFRPDVAKLVQSALKQSPSALGVGYAQVGTEFVAAVACGRSKANVTELALEPDAQGMVSVAGELTFDGEAIRALVNQGPRAVKSCTRDEAVALPRFRFACSVAPDDASAWIQVIAQRRGRVIAEPVLDLLAVRPGATTNTLSVMQKAKLDVSSAEEFEAHALVAINEMRREAGLTSLALHAKQTEATRAMAPHFFHALHVADDYAQADTIATGLLAGWEVEKTIRDGSFVAGIVASSHDVHAWVSLVLDAPIGREALLNPEAQALALGGVVGSEPTVLGALAYTYAFFDGHDHAKDANELAERIKAARASAGVPAAPRAMSVEGRAWQRAREVLLSGRDPESALQDALQDAAYISESGVRGYVIATTQPGAMELPKELLGPRVTSFAVASSHYQPKGSRWAVQVLFILFTERPGGDV